MYIDALYMYIHAIFLYIHAIYMYIHVIHMYIHAIYMSYAFLRLIPIRLHPLLDQGGNPEHIPTLHNPSVQARYSQW